MENIPSFEHVRNVTLGPAHATASTITLENRTRSTKNNYRSTIKKNTCK